MTAKELTKRIIDTCIYNEMCPDQDLMIDYACEVAPILIEKNPTDIATSIIHPLMDQYRDAEDRNELSYIKDTITMVLEYIGE